ncbi:MAG TPA: AMP-binding protein, partial [Candidatus Omnitrophota bacterium]|nr:AMP-binding protein [Candidatus Omnitrophota bacterium]
LRGRNRRRAAGERMFDILSDMTFATTDTGRTIPEAVMDACAIHGGGGKLMEDIERKPVGYRKILLGCLVLGRKLARLSRPCEAVGVLLPNAVGSAVTVLALQTYGRVPAMLNFTAGPANLLSACTGARVNTVLTSRRFVEMARLGETVAKLADQVKVVYLDDVRATIGVMDKLRGLLSLPLIRRIHRRLSSGPDAPAVILFTSGSEGIPKGVVLSHRNIVANCAQIAARIDFTSSDTVLNALPIFHAFGLTAGTVLPLVAGLKVFLYPSPLHYRIVPEVAYDTGATVMFGTDTFLNGYARMAHPYDFHSVRFVVAGAEKVKDSTRAAWMEKFGLRILEGYGATETAPVLAVNTPMQFRSGSVGRLLPGIEARVEPVPGIESGGRLSVKGPNVMLGYFKADHPGELQPPPDGWYDTGDIVSMDEAGFVRIQGRAKRFAKVAGEMVSLGAVEDLVEKLWPGHAHAVVTVPDERKGEQLVLVSTFPEAERGPLAQWMKGQGASDLAVPRTIQVREKLPVLGTGKTDYVTLEREVRGA